MKKSYFKPEWQKFSKEVLHRDGYRCLKCGRDNTQVILQAHHKEYIKGRLPWEYPLSACITLCKGCHAVEHEIIEPSAGWTLISINDLEDLVGTCERDGCGHSIRYEHLTYHPKVGYKIVGSTCIEHLTKSDKEVSKDVLNVLKKISSFFNKSLWHSELTKSGNYFITTTHSWHKIRIYGDINNYSFQILIKKTGVNWYDYKDIFNLKNKSLERVKELSFIALSGLITKKANEKEILRNIYKRML